MPKSAEPQTVFGRRLREARVRRGIAQDKLGVQIGLDELSSSARISRYECGIHAPPFPIAEKLADALGVPVAFLFCPDDRLANLIVTYDGLKKRDRDAVIGYAQELSIP